MAEQSREEMIKEMIESDPNDPMLYFTLGNHYMDESRHEEAAEALGKAVELDENYSAAWLALGRARVALHLEDEAREAFQRAIDRASERGDLRVRNEAREALDQLDEF